MPKSFKQYLLEVPMVFSANKGVKPWSTPEEALGLKPGSMEKKLLGKIGSYEVHHYTDPYNEIVGVSHKGKHIGEFPIEEDGYIDGHININQPTVHPSHRGKNAKTRNLVPKVYSMIAKHIAPIASGDQQSLGGRSIWKRLAKMHDVRISHGIGRWRPSIEMHTHPMLPTPITEFQRTNYEEAHDSVSNGYDGIGVAKKLLKSFGMDKDRLSRITKLPHLPLPSYFRSKKIDLSGRYDPKAHDKYIYAPAYPRDDDPDETAADYRLVLNLDKKRM